MEVSLSESVFQKTRLREAYRKGRVGYNLYYRLLINKLSIILKVDLEVKVFFILKLNRGVHKSPVALVVR